MTLPLITLVSPAQTHGDEGIYWQVNFERFHLYFRDQAIISAVANKLDQVRSNSLHQGEVNVALWRLFYEVVDSRGWGVSKELIYFPSGSCKCFFSFIDCRTSLLQTSSEIVRTILRMSEVTTSPTASCTKPLSSNEIFRALPSSYNIGRHILDQYLTLLVDDPVRSRRRISYVNIFYISNVFRDFYLPLISFLVFDFLRWSLLVKLVKVEEGCLLSVSFFI